MSYGYPQYPQQYVYPPANAAYPYVERKHSGIGMASLVLALLSALSLVAMIGASVVIVADDPAALEDENSPKFIVVFVLLLASLVMMVVGLGLGVGGALQRDRKKLFGILGLISNIVMLLMIVGFFVVALLAGEG
jgi:cytochrome c biogenesis protein CcdA